MHPRCYSAMNSTNGGANITSQHVFTSIMGVINTHDLVLKPDIKSKETKLVPGTVNSVKSHD